jgi:hypothetical protein
MELVQKEWGMRMEGIEGMHADESNLIYIK